MTRSRDLANLGDNTSTLENQGLTLIKTESFSAVSSHSVNDVFSATYDNYFLAITVDTISTSSQDLLLRLRVGGADNSSNNYRWAGLISFDTATSISVLKSSGLTSSFRIGTVYLTTNTSFTGITLVNPFRTEETGYSTTSVEYDATNSVMRTLSGVMSVTTSYTGFTILPAANNITGSVQVYGYKK
jgi:hypothetical protein